MATSVLEIDVHSEQFKEFLALFKGYQKAVKDMPAAWREATAAATGSADTIADQTAAILAQNKLLHDQAMAQRELHREEDKADRKARDRAAETRRKNAEDRKEAEKADRARQKRQDDFNKSIDKAARTTGGILKNVGAITWGLAKWGVGALLGGAAGAWGLGAFAGSIGDSLRQSQGLGVSTADMQAYRLSFGRFVDADSNLNRIADAQSDYSKRWAFNAMGIDPTGKDAAQLATIMAPRAREMFIQGGRNQQYAEAMGLTQFYSMEELRRLAENSPEDLARAQSQYAKTRNDLAISEKAQKGWQDFSIALATAGTNIKNVFGEALDKLTPKLTELATTVTETITSFLESDNFKEWVDMAAEGLKNFVSYISSDKFQSDVSTFFTNFSLICQKIVDGLQWLGVIPGNPSTTPSGEPSSGNAMNDIKYADPSWRPPSEATKARSDQAMRFFMAQGWTKEQAAGWAANIQAESNFNPFAKGDRNWLGQPQAYGLAQWHPDRRAAYTELFGHTMESVKDPAQAATEQLQFMHWEATQGNEKAAGDKIKATTTAYDAGAAVSKYYERPKDREGEAHKRGQNAQYNINVNNNTGGSASVTTATMP